MGLTVRGEIWAGERRGMKRTRENERDTPRARQTQKNSESKIYRRK